MNHFNGVHQSRQSINNLLWGAVVEWVDEFFQGSKIFNIVLSLVKLFCKG